MPADLQAISARHVFAVIVTLFQENITQPMVAWSSARRERPKFATAALLLLEIGLAIPGKKRLAVTNLGRSGVLFCIGRHASVVS